MFSNQRLFVVASTLVCAQSFAAVAAAPNTTTGKSKTQTAQSNQSNPNQSNSSKTVKVPIAIGADGRQILVNITPPVRSQVKLKLPVSDSSLWFRYYQAGEEASLTRHDKDLAKKYWMASLSELEKHPPAKGSDMFLSVKLSALEAGLMNLYPSDWSKESGDSDAILSRRKEHVELLQRIANINTFYAPKDDLFRIKANERYALAKQSYDKALAQAKQTQTERTQAEPKTE